MTAPEPPRPAPWKQWGTDLEPHAVRQMENACLLPVAEDGLLHEFLMPIPPLAEQKRIVAKVAELMPWVDQFGEQLASSRTLAAQLTTAS